MKHIFIIFVLSSSISFSQSTFTFPFSSDSSRWIYVHSNAFTEFTDTISYQLGNDTLMPNKQTYKAYGRNFYFRKDSSRIYQYLSDSSEFVRYDFSKKAGDTISYTTHGSYVYATIITGDQDKTVLGWSRRVMTFHGNGGVWDDVADSIGIMDFSLGTEDYYQLTGAIISGISYGYITSVATKKGLIPNTPYLSQNYPNPFNPATTIGYEISTGMNVRIIITNEIGQQVAILVNSYKQPGSYRIEWNASNCASGIYYCTMSSNGFLKTTKLVLLK
jgi:hypothetical protein